MMDWKHCPPQPSASGARPGFALIKPFDFAQGKLRVVRKRTCEAFTLIELLVVIAIIAILAAMLIPAVTSALERGRRTTCQSGQRQILIATQTYAADNEGRYPVTEREAPNLKEFSASSLDHVSWVSGYFYDHFAEEYGIKLDEFQCPNRPKDWIISEPIGRRGVRWRTSFYLLFGRDVSKFDRMTWNSPINYTADPSLYVTADITEKGTYDPATSSASHGDRGLVEVPGIQEPEDFGSAGGNIGYVNGSVRWVPQDEFVPNPSVTGGGRNRGYWPSTPPELRAGN